MMHEMPGISSSVRAIKTALDDLLPEVFNHYTERYDHTFFIQAIISIIMYFYDLSYQQAVEHYLLLSLPY